jgi:hypothetical protein
MHACRQAFGDKLGNAVIGLGLGLDFAMFFSEKDPPMTVDEQKGQCGDVF